MMDRDHFTRILTALGILGVLAAQSGSHVSALSSRDQERPRSTSLGALSGEVLDSSGQPQDDTVVALGGPITERRVVTDSSGRFVFEGVPPGSFSLRAAKSGYLATYLGETSAQPLTSPTQISVSASEWVRDVRLIIYRTASLSGTIRDENGLPVALAPVRVMRRIWNAGTPGWSVDTWTTTNDLGEYRLPRLRAGQYLVTVPLGGLSFPTTFALNPRVHPSYASQLDQRIKGPAGSLLVGDVPPRAESQGGYSVYPPRYYPGVMDVRSAQPVLVEEGAHLSGLDVRLQSVPAGSLTGKLVGSRSAPGILIRLLAEGSGSLSSGFETAMTVSDSEGAFSFTGVPSGTYHVLAGGSRTYYRQRLDCEPTCDDLAFHPAATMTPIIPVLTAGGWAVSYVDNAAKESWAAGIVEVSAKAAHVELAMTRGSTVSGRIELVPASSGRVGPAFLVLEPVTFDSPSAVYSDMTDQKGLFAIANVPPGRYLVRTSLGLTETVLRSTQDISRLPLIVGSEDIDDMVVRVTIAVASLSGTVTLAGNQTATSVVLIPADRMAWSSRGGTWPETRVTRTSTASGRYSFDYVRPGDYFVVAVDRLADDWETPKVLETMSAIASRLSLTAGPNSHDIRVGR